MTLRFSFDWLGDLRHKRVHEDRMTIDRGSKLDELLEEARKLPPMTEDQRAEQAMCFAYGNLACSTNHKPVKAAFLIASRRYGWSEERFLKWAEGKEWRTL